MVGCFRRVTIWSACVVCRLFEFYCCIYCLFVSSSTDVFSSSFSSFPNTQRRFILLVISLITTIFLNSFNQLQHESASTMIFNLFNIKMSSLFFQFVDVFFFNAISKLPNLFLFWRVRRANPVMIFLLRTVRLSLVFSFVCLIFSVLNR